MFGSRVSGYGSRRVGQPVAGFFRESPDEFSDFRNIIQVAALHVLADVDRERDFSVSQVAGDPVKGSAASGEIPGGVVVFADSVNRNLAAFDFAAFQEIDVLL